MNKVSGKLICFTGVDGSGKTTQAKLLAEELSKSGSDAVYIWSRGQAGWRKILITLGRSVLGVSTKNISNKDEHYYKSYQDRKSNQIFRLFLARFIWLLAVKIEHIAQIRFGILALLRSGKVVVSDRYLWDSTIDLAVSFSENGDWLVNWFNRFMAGFVPKPDLVFFLDIPPEVALQRKSDIPNMDYVKNRVGLYRALSPAQAMFQIDGCLSEEQVALIIKDQVTKLIFPRDFL